MNRKLIVYFDNCCYSRLFDTIKNAQIKAEAEKIQFIIDNRFFGNYDIIGSLVVISEIRGIADAIKRKAVIGRYFDTISGNVQLYAQGLARAYELHLMGLGKMDSRHLAAAETAGADFLLTTDADFIKKCAKKKLTTVTVINPLDF